MKEPVTRSHEVVLLGRKFKLRTNHDARYLARLAEHVTDQVNELQRKGATSTLDAALLAALKLTEESWDVKREAEERLAAVGEKTKTLLALVEEQLAGASKTAPADRPPATGRETAAEPAADLAVAAELRR